MQDEDVEAAMRPESDRAVADRDEQPEEDIGRREKYGDEAYVRTDINKCDPHEEIVNGWLGRVEELYDSLRNGLPHASNRGLHGPPGPGSDKKDPHLLTEADVGHQQCR